MTTGFQAREKVDAQIAERGLVAAGGELGMAAILYTYQCTIACRHCCFGCAADRPRLHMATDQAVEHLRALHELGRVVHIAGGECMMYWADLRDVLERSFAQGVQAHFIETNCSFATDDATVAERLGVLKANGLAGILMSADPFHQAFVPPERFLRVRRQALGLFGPENVWCPRDPDERIMDFAEIARDEERLRDYVRNAGLTIVGTAHRELRQYLDPCTLDELQDEVGWRVRDDIRDCAAHFDRDRMWEVHIDPYSNIQTNCGVILGNTQQVTLAEVMARGPAEANAITRLLAQGGPRALADFARENHGFVPPERVVSTCDLCYTTRTFLRPLYPEVLGPAEVYGA